MSFVINHLLALRGPLFSCPAIDPSRPNDKHALFSALFWKTQTTMSFLINDLLALPGPAFSWRAGEPLLCSSSAPTSPSTLSRRFRRTPAFNYNRHILFEPSGHRRLADDRPFAQGQPRKPLFAKRGFSLQPPSSIVASWPICKV